MKGLVSMEGLAALALLLSGCIVYQMDKTPPCDGLSDAARAECKFKPKCLLKCEMKVQERTHFGRQIPITYGETKKEALVPAYKSAIVREVQESRLFSSCIDTFDCEKTADDVYMTAICDFTKTEDVLQKLSGVFTLSFYPAVLWNYYFSYTITVKSAYGQMRQYHFDEVIRDRGGMSLLLALPFETDANYEEVFAAMNRKVMNNLFVKMQQDGFFSAEGRDKAAAAKADVVEAAKKTVAARRKELEDLKKAGVITEDEYRKEIEGVVK